MKKAEIEPLPTLTPWECDVIGYAAAGSPDLSDTDTIWDAIVDLQNRALIVEVPCNKCTRLIPTPLALAARFAAIEQTAPES